MTRRFFFLALIACAFTLAGCSTPQTRISENPGIYNSLSPTDQALVSRGDIREGMSQDAVFLAWGPPNQRGPGRNRGSRTENWLYFGTTAGDYYPPIHAYGGYYGGFAYLHRHRSGRLHRHVYYDPFYDPWFYRRTSVISYPERIVSFQNGRVIAFQFLPEPRFF
jgi:hypothetical protein